MYYVYILSLIRSEPTLARLAIWPAVFQTTTPPDQRTRENSCRGVCSCTRHFL